METKYRTTSRDVVHEHTSSVLSSPAENILPTTSALKSANASLLESLPKDGLGLQVTTAHLIQDVTPGFNASSLSPNYYGFVTGGTTPAAFIADNIVSLYDQNVQVHQPEWSVVTVVEDRALSMLMELFNLVPLNWNGRTFTTGATASNVLGLACGREHVINYALGRSAPGNYPGGVGELGILEACRKANVSEIAVLTTMPHSSLRKAASVVGIGRASVIDVGEKANPLAFDLELLEEHLKNETQASIVALSCGEINTGDFATHGIEEVRQISNLCKKYNSWLHVDGAFGMYAGILEGAEFERISGGAAGISLADSIAGDAHKLLNVPYDCGFFFCKDSHPAYMTFQNPNAAYLNVGGPQQDVIASPLHIGIENSRRSRGIPVYATLMAYGRSGYREMLERQTKLARSVADWLDKHERFEVLPPKFKEEGKLVDNIFMIVLFRAKDTALNAQLVSRINSSSKMFVSATVWDGVPASRIAVSNWQVDVVRDFRTVKDVLEGVLQSFQQNPGEPLTT